VLQTLGAMRERLAGLVGRRPTAQEEGTEKLKATEAALQDAHRERQVRACQGSGPEPARAQGTRPARVQGRNSSGPRAPSCSPFLPSAMNL
jgi:hypothetical protein